MGDSEAVAAGATAVVNFPVAEYNNSSAASYADASSDAAPAPGSYTIEAAASRFSEGSDYGSDPNNVAAGVTAGHNNAVVDSSINGDLANEVGNATENGNAFDSSTAYVAGSAPVMSAEEERLWNILRANSSDFNAWTALIEETEKVAENDVVKIRKVYDTFLEEFPLCYGYWKKYADHEARIGSMDKVVEVYERAVQAVTYSVDIWLLYCVFAMGTYGEPETIRRLFERGLAYVGTDYLSSPLWDKYIEYEYMHEQWARLASIYTRILENPIQQLDKYLTSFRELAASRPLTELRTAEESAAVAEGAGSEARAQTTEEEARPDTGEKSPRTVSAGITEAEELKKYIAIREEMYQKAKEFDSKIIGFETAIRRPYFHVRPLSIAELENWHNFLDFMERECDFNKVVKLYERCLIACANYPEYWIRYILSMETSQSLDLAENALARATQVFVKGQPEIHLFAARFKEQNGDVTGARAAYQLVHTEISPGLLEAIVKHANMECRLGSVDDAYSLYEQAIAIEKGKVQSQILPMLYAQYSHFVYLVSGNAEKAREILKGALDHIQLSKPFLEALMHFETILPTKQIDYLESLVHKFVTSNSDSSMTTNTTDREDLSSIFLEFLGLFGDLQSIKSAEDRHARLFLPHKPFSELRKRNAEDFLASDRAKLAKSSLAAPTPATPSLMGAYPNTQNQWPAAYGAQTQAWPPVTQAQAQAQAQQWAPGYAQQAGYAAYNSTYSGSYATPQVPASVPQSTAYAAYPSTYPVQSYAQPAAAATLTPVQQPATVSQNYYGNNYY